ncbi:MAG: YraN family protein [Treponemataceae bacterium]|nr:YraN family protein [Treponemataceae bacterium]
MVVAKISTRAVGNAGEDKACLWLRSRGYEIVARNWRSRRGEIDIIAQKDGVLVFAEVKTLPSGELETLAHELDRRKQKRIVETAQLFLANHRKYKYTAIRFDVLVVDMPDWSEVYHIEDAFSEPV